MDLEDQLETMTSNMNYIQSNVTECQNNIMQMEEEAKVCYFHWSFLFVKSLKVPLFYLFMAGNVYI